MELASMLAGEPFTDHPASVCPVIGSFLRAYNDTLDSDRRQDLYAYASVVVNSARPAVVQHARAVRLVAWGREARGRRRLGSLRSPWLSAIGVVRKTPIDLLGVRAVRSIPKLTDELHTSALALIDELVAIDSVEVVSAPVSSTVSSPDRIALIDLVGGTHRGE
jgi:uncharacterized protein YjiS (DUF1127 family)